MTPSNSGSWMLRLATTSASLGALALLPQKVDAAVVKVTGRPVSNSFSYDTSSSVGWDVDGDGASDFFIGNELGTVSIDGKSYKSAYFRLNAFLRFKYSAAGQFVPVLQTGDVVSGPNSQFFFRTKNDVFKGIEGRPGRSFEVANPFRQFSPGINYFGFRFHDNQYGYARMEFNPDPATASITITDWAYETVPGQSITVAPFEAVPAPIGLAGLAAGAAWTRRLRRRIHAAARSSQPCSAPADQP